MLFLFELALIFQSPPSPSPLPEASEDFDPDEWIKYNYCACDTTPGICDPFCCCDPDCPASVRSDFEFCLPQIVGNATDIKYCDEDLTDSAASVTDWLKNTMFCVHRDDNPVKGDFYAKESNTKQSSPPSDSFYSFQNDGSFIPADPIPGQPVDVSIYRPDSNGFCYKTKLRYYEHIDEICIATDAAKGLTFTDLDYDQTKGLIAADDPVDGIVTTQISWVKQDSTSSTPSNEFEYQEIIPGFLLNNIPVRFQMNMCDVTYYSTAEVQAAMEDTIPDEIADAIQAEDTPTVGGTKGYTKTIDILYEESGTIFAPTKQIKEINVRYHAEQWIGPEYNDGMTNSADIYVAKPHRITKYVRFFKLPNSINTNPKPGSLWTWLPF